MEKRKWKALIVDDEFRIALLIRKLIHWETLGMECVAVLDSGVKALQMIEEEELDVVITDIRIPVVSGFDLISKAEEMGKDIRFVVVSGYKEFEYAHKALQYGVVDYLLKPINEEELNRVLGKIGDKLVEKDNRHLDQKELEDSLSMSRKIIKRDFLKNIIEQEHELMEEASEAEAGVALKGEIYRGIDIKLDYADYRQYDKKQDRLTLEYITSMVERILGNAADEVLICVKENLHIYCMLNYDSGKSRRVKDGINDSLNAIKEYLLGFEQYEVTIGVGSERMVFGEMRFSIRESHEAADNRIKLGTGRLIYYTSICCEPKEAVRERIEQCKKNFLSSIENYSAEAMKQCVNQIFSEFILQDERDFSQCYKIAEELIRLFFERIDMREEGKPAEEQMQNGIQHCYTISQMKRLLKNELGGYMERYMQAMEAEATRPVRQAKQYVEEHYGEKITLEDLAEIAGLNPVYFSVLFKNETGENFSAYLTNFRMEKAKELILSTNETVAAIANRVGYKDSRYFSQTFAKLVGVKPALYRKLHA